MFKIFDRKKNQLDLLENPISPVIVNELGGIGELSFSVPSTYKYLELEGYIQVENDHEYVIKEIVTHGTNREVVCILNIEEILGMAWSKFISRENTLMKCAELVLSGTGWRAINKSSCTVSRNLYGTVTNSYNLLQMMCTIYNVEFIFDTYNKTVTFVDKVGKDAGVYFINDINLKQLNIDTHTHKYITRVIPVGKDGLTIESVNGGKNYLENKTYSNKNIYGIWQSDKHDNPSALKADAQRFLDEMAIPYETYEVLVDDLYALRGIESFKYELGDVVTIIDGETETRIQQRVIQRTYNLLEPDKDTLHIANKDATFEDYYKRLQTIADMTQSVIGSDGTISGGNISDGTVSGDKLEQDSITSDHISSGSITSEHIKAEQILADHIMANQITTNHLVANSITSDHIQANTIDTKHLKANTITSEHIQSNTIQSNHISSNTITSGHIQAGAITAGSGIIADGAIGSAQISKLDAGKIESGTIDTSKITVQGANGHLRLKGNRMQVFDGIGNQAKERVSIGDVNGDGTVYGLRVRGKDGATVLLDENGVTSEGITDGSITNDKINEDANIDGAKLNINSVVNKINEDGTEVIKGTKIEVDGTNLGVKLSEITNKQSEDGEKITQAQAQITANQNAINLKVDEQVYTTDKANLTSKLEKNTSDISLMKDQIALKVEQTDIENIKNELETSLESKISETKSEIQITTDAISQKVGKLESDTTMLDGKVTSHESRLAVAEQKITDKAITSVVQDSQFVQNMNGQITTNKNNISKVEQTANSITSTVSDLNGKYTQLKQTVDGIDMTGKVSFSDLSTSGKTVINGANITTGTMSADRISGGTIQGSLLQTYANDSTRGVRIAKDSMQLNNASFFYKTNDEFRIQSQERFSVGSMDNIYLMTGLNPNGTQNGYGEVVIPNATLRTQKLNVVNDANMYGSLAVSSSVSASSFKVGNYQVYHQGNKPTPSEIGASPSSHTHSYLPLSGGTVSGALTVSGSLYAKGLADGYINWWVLSSGVIYAGKSINMNGYTITGQSDRSLKENINYVDRVKNETNLKDNFYNDFKDKFKFATYNYKKEDQKDRTHFGFVAQDIEDTSFSDYVLMKAKDENNEDVLGYDIQALINVYGSILQKEIEIRDNQIKDLENRLSKLENLLNKGE